MTDVIDLPRVIGDDAVLPEWISQRIVDPAAYADDRIYEAYRWMRANNPVGLARPEGYDPFWVITRHADVKQVLRNNALFHSGELASMLTDKASDDFVRELTGGSPHLGRSLIQLDAPDHMKQRLLTQSWFMPRKLRSLEERIRQIADRSVEDMLRRAPQCDFASEVALHYPLRVIMEILGVPPEDEPQMLRLTQEIFAPRDPDSMTAGVEAMDPSYLGRAMAAVVRELDEYFLPLEADRRANPRNDVISIVANALIDGQPLKREDARGYYIIVATAGHDTTSSSTAGAMLALAQDPELFRRIKADRSLIPALLEEAIRFQTPVKTFMRTCMEDTEVGGRRIGAGDWMMVCYGAANRDETVFPDPDRFSIDRRQVEQMAFGFGAHVCLGQHLARMEMRILFEQLLDRIDSVELAGSPTQIQSFFVNGPKNVPIRFTAH